MERPETSDAVPSPETDYAPEHTPASLRGSFVAVLVMAAFFCVVWFGVLAILLERR